MFFCFPSTDKEKEINIEQQVNNNNNNNNKVNFDPLSCLWCFFLQIENNSLFVYFFFSILYSQSLSYCIFISISIEWLNINLFIKNIKNTLSDRRISNVTEMVRVKN